MSEYKYKYEFEYKYKSEFDEEFTPKVNYIKGNPTDKKPDKNPDKQKYSKFDKPSPLVASLSLGKTPKKSKYVGSDGLFVFNEGYEKPTVYVPILSVIHAERESQLLKWPVPLKDEFVKITKKEMTDITDLFGKISQGQKNLSRFAKSYEVVGNINTDRNIKPLKDDANKGAKVSDVQAGTFDAKKPEGFSGIPEITVDKNGDVINTKTGEIISKVPETKGPKPDKKQAKKT